MALRSRLTKLESIANRTQPDDPNKSGRMLFDMLARTAAKLTGTEFSKAWCDGASNCDLAGAAMLESQTETRSPALWENVIRLSNQGGSVGNLFAAILDQANGD